MNNSLAMKLLLMAVIYRMILKCILMGCLKAIILIIFLVLEEENQ